MQAQDGAGEDAGEFLFRRGFLKRIDSHGNVSVVNVMSLRSNPRWLTWTDVEASNLVRFAT